MMHIADRWLLPDGVEDVLPPQAMQLEQIRRRLLDLYETWGYRYVIPPMVEFLESLLTGTGHDLDLKTFKVVDLLSGRTMGIRADITPQVARIDAHSLNREGVIRLCYAGTIVQSQPDTMLANRTPLSVGAELFGDTSNKADLEIVSLMVESLKSLGLEKLHIELGDVAIFRQMMANLAISDEQKNRLFAMVQKKALAELREAARSFGLSEHDVDLICKLPSLCGARRVLEEARAVFNKCNDSKNDNVLESINNLEQVADALGSRYSDLNIYFDLSELRGYAYHTGIVFAAYVEGAGEVIAKGGRYDHIGEVFGRDARGATGFSINIHSLLAPTSIKEPEKKRVCVGTVPEALLATLWQEIQRLRESGYIVIDTGVEAAMETVAETFDFILEYIDDQWQLLALEEHFTKKLSAKEHPTKKHPTKESQHG